MKLLLQSDLHNELLRRRGIEPDALPATDADVVVLAGDIDEGMAGVYWAVDQARALGRPLLYVPGNHEYYRHCYPETLEAMRQAAAGSPVTVLDRESRVLDGVRFVGVTLWTDFRVTGKPDAAMAAAAETLLDYRRIRVSDPPAEPRLAVPEDTRRWHEAAVDWLRSELEKSFSGPTVVVSHMAPSPRSSHPEFGLNDTVAAFLSDLEHLMDPARVALWLHGHTHANVNYRVNGVRVISNQRGYPGETVPGDYRPGGLISV